MNAEQLKQRSIHIDREQLLSFVRTMIGGNRGPEDDKHALRPGPLDSLVRVALERAEIFDARPEPWRVFGHPVPWRTIEAVFSPQLEPWKAILEIIAAKYPAIWELIGGGPNFGAEVALNPQPLPPRFAFLVSLARTAISRAELIQDIADATRREGEQQGSIGYINRLTDELCPREFRLRWPFPWPRPNWFTEELSGIDLVVIATQFEQAAKETFSQDLRQNLVDASGKLAEAGLSKMQ